MSEKKKDNKNKVLISALIISVIVFIVGIVILVKFFGEEQGNKDLVMTAFMVLMGLLIIIGVTFVFTLNKKNTAKYDEREILVQGQSYKYGFYTLLIYFGIAGFLLAADLIPFLSVSIVCVTGIMTGLLVYAGHALWNDAYFPLNQRRSTVFWVLGIMGLSNLMIGVLNCLKHGFITDGKLNIFSVNFVCVAAIIILIAEIIVKMIVEKNEDKE